MKNKNLQHNNKKAQQKTLNVPPNPPKNIKNREQLRKKLKDLLAKQVISPPPKNTSKELPKVSNGISSKDKSSFSNKSKKQNGYETSLKQKTPKNLKANKTPNMDAGNKKEFTNSNLNKPNKGKKSKASKEAISKGNDSSLKRKLKNKTKPPEEISPPSSIKKPLDKASDTLQDLINGNKKAKKSLQPPKKKTKEEPSQPSLSKPKKAKSTKTNESPAKKKKTNKKQKYAQGRGPLRPPTPDSEFDPDIAADDCQQDINTPDVDTEKSSKTEHALVRANNEFEGSDSENHADYNSYLDYLFDGNANEYSEDEEFNSEGEEEISDDDDEYETGSDEYESSEEYEEYSDDETWEDYSSNDDDDVEDYFDTSDDNESYTLPENVPEDVYIAQGTAVKYELPNTDIGFDSDSQCTQIIELPTKSPEKEIPKPPTKQNKLSKKTNKQSAEESDDSCPELVPIEEEEDEDEYDEESFGSEYTGSHSCCSDCSCGSEDEYSESAHSEGEFEPMTPEVFKVKKSDLECNAISEFIDANCPQMEDTSCVSILEEIENASLDPKKCKIYTSHNKLVTDDWLSNNKDERKKVQKNIDKVPKKKTPVANSFAINKATQTDVVENSPSQNKQPIINTSIETPKKQVAVLQNTLQPQNATKRNVSLECSTIEMQTALRENSAEPALDCTPQKPPAKKAKIVPQDVERDVDMEKPSSLPKPSPIPTTKPSPLIKKDKPNQSPKPLTRTLFFNAVNCNHVIVLLKDPLYFYGTVKVKLLAGCVNIFGYNPKRNEVLELFSPRGYAFLQIEASHSSGERALLNEKEILSLTPFFIRSDLEEIIDKFDHSKDAILILERNDRSKKVGMLRKYMVEHLFPNMNSIQSDRPFYTSEFLLRCIITPRTDTPLLVNPEWNEIRVENNSKIMLIGGKAVGKSTLLRYLVNKNLNQYEKILLIDLDIGQPELFVPQTISATTLTEPLLGPGYLLTKQPDKAFLVGDIDIVQSVQAYIESLKALAEYCNGKSDYKNIPWIVNTMGYNKGFGDELISVICSLLKPSNIVQLESQKENNDFDVVMMKDNIKSIERNILGDICKPDWCEFEPKHQLTLIKAFIPSKSRYQQNNEWNMKPREMRLAMILSRLSCILVGHAEWLTDVKPLCASIDDLHIIKMSDDHLHKEDLVKTLVGNLVYLCRLEAGKAHECLGIGIVRGIDYPLRQLYLLPSIPHCQLENVNCLAVCGIPLPSSILLNQGPKVKGIASYVYNTLDEASSMYIKHMINKPQPYSTGKRRHFAN